VKKADASMKLDVRKLLEEFQKAEESPARHNGTFKIDAPFENALDTIIKAKPDSKKAKVKG
jgi:hypothetical protein